MEFIPGKQSCFYMCKSMNVICHTNKLKNKSHIIALINSEKKIWQKPTFSHDKNIKQIGYWNNISQYNHSNVQQCYIQHCFGTGIAGIISTIIRQGCLHRPELFNITLEVLARANRYERNQRDTNSKEEIQVTSVPDETFIQRNWRFH